MHFIQFGCIRDRLVALQKSVQNEAELVQKVVPQSRVGIIVNEHTGSTPFDPKLMFLCILNHLGAFGTVWLPTKLGAKRAELVQKFVPRSRVGIFQNESTRSTPLDPKLTFWFVSYYLVAFGTVGPN